MKKSTRAIYLIVIGSLITSGILAGLSGLEIGDVLVWLSPIAGLLGGAVIRKYYMANSRRNGRDSKGAFDEDSKKHLEIFPKHIQALEDLCEEVLPVWNSRIERAQLEVRDAVDLLKPKIKSIHSQLAEAHRLSKMMERGISVRALSGNADRTAETYKNLFSDIVSDLRSSLKLRNSLLNLDGKLSILSSELKHMAAETASISMRWVDLNLNDSIGDDSCGTRQHRFRIVAARVRELANISLQTGFDIASQLEQANSSIISAFNAVEEHVRRNVHLLDGDRIITRQVFETIRSEFMVRPGRVDNFRGNGESEKIATGVTKPISGVKQKIAPAFS